MTVELTVMRISKLKVIDESSIWSGNRGSIFAVRGICIAQLITFINTESNHPSRRQCSCSLVSIYVDAVLLPSPYIHIQASHASIIQSISHASSHLQDSELESVQWFPRPPIQCSPPSSTLAPLFHNIKHTA
jgi:hypothetical protein